MIVNIIILLLFSISLVPENIGFNFTFELRSLIFAIGVAGVIGSLILNMFVPMNRDAQKYRQIKNLYIFGNWWCNGILGKSKFKFISIDIAFIAVTILAVISFVTKTESIYAFHYVFVQVGMAVVYFTVRYANSDEIILWRKIIYSIIGFGFIVAVIGLIQFVMGKPVVSTFGRTSYLGCFLAMNAAIALGTALQLRITNYELQITI